MLDPVISSLLAFLFALMLVTAGAHKLSDRLRFQGILAAYQILPSALIKPFGFLIPLLEVTLGLLWLITWRTDFVSFATAALLSAYTLAIAVNLMRGRIYIDCGCSFSSGKGVGGAGTTQSLSVWLVLRNLVLVALALATTTEFGNRGFGLLDYFSIVAAALVLVFIYAAFNQLLVNQNAINSWRKPVKAGLGKTHE